MIDFLNPRSKKHSQTLIFGLVGMLILLSGMAITYRFVDEYIQAKTLSSINYLPSGDMILEDLDTKELLALYDKPEDVSPASDSSEIVPYNEPVLSEEVNSKKDVHKNNTPPTSPKVETKVKINTNKQVENKREPIPIPDYNMLVVPQMGVRGKIYEGETEKTLLKGLWRMPGTSDNPLSGNMVVTAHRYLRRPPDPNTFYLLDKLKKGDEFYMYWQGKKYNYRVREIKIVKPEEISILFNTPHPQLTLFSCTPLFTSKNRLVVISDLIK